MYYEQKWIDKSLLISLIHIGLRIHESAYFIKYSRLKSINFKDICIFTIEDDLKYSCGNRRHFNEMGVTFIWIGLAT